MAITTWMNESKLKINEDKTGFIFIGSKDNFQK